MKRASLLEFKHAIGRHAGEIRTEERADGRFLSVLEFRDKKDTLLAVRISREKSIVACYLPGEPQP